MCDQCVSGSGQLGEVVPGWVLFYTQERGVFAEAGMYCLAPSPPTVLVSWEPKVFDATPEVIPTSFFIPLTMPPEAGYDLVSQALQAGFDPRNTSFTDWMFRRIHAMVTANPVHKEGK